MVDLTFGKFILKNADYVIAISKAGEKWIRTTFQREKNISVIYRGFEIKNFSKKENTIPKIGFIGRLVPLKNLGALIEALAEIQEKKWELQIVGE